MFCLQDNDFQPLQPGDPVFLSFSGETLKHEGEEFYPFFVNECAYYEKKTAFHLARRTTFTLPSIGLRSWEQQLDRSRSWNKVQTVWAPSPSTSWRTAEDQTVQSPVHLTLTIYTSVNHFKINQPKYGSEGLITFCNLIKWKHDHFKCNFNCFFLTSV